MKTVKLKLIASLFAFVLLTATAATAQVGLASSSLNSVEPLVVKYIGNDEGYLLFEVTVQSADVRPAVLGISDKDEELFSGIFRTNFKVQRLKIEKRGNQELSFRLISGKHTYVKTFSVNTSRVENTVVAENGLSVL